MKMNTWFLSSSFADMNNDRDLVHKVFSDFKQKCREHSGDDAQLVDLRIGINTFPLEDAKKMSYVLTVCKEKIESSYGIIILLGDRYGSSIDKDTIQSVTHWEIDNALSRLSSMKFIVCIRTLHIRGPFSSKEEYDKYFETDENQKKALEDLKKHLSQQSEVQVIEYEADWDGKKVTNFRTTAGKNFAKTLENLLVATCHDDWIAFEKLQWQDREKRMHFNWQKDRAHFFVGRVDKLEQLKARLQDGGKIFLKGPKGSGKSTLISRVIQDLDKQNAFCVFVGLSPNSADPLSILMQMVYFAEDRASEEHLSFDNDPEPFISYKLRLEKLCRKIHERIYYVIDDVDGLSNDEHKKYLDFLPLSENVTCLVSGANFNFSDAQNFFGIKVVNEIPLTFLKDNEVKEIFRGILEREHKELFDETLSAVLKKEYAKKSPLWLEMVAQLIGIIPLTKEFQTLEDYADVPALTAEFIIGSNNIVAMPNKPEQAAVHLIDMVTKQLKLDKQTVRHAVQLIAVSSCGLRISDLREIFVAEHKVFVEADFELLRKFLSSLFCERTTSNFIDFSHSLIRDGILNAPDLNKYNVEKKIAEHVRILPDNDPLRCIEGARSAKILGNRKFFAQLLKEATDSKNSTLLHGLKQSFLEDDGKFCIDLLNHFNELPPKLVDGCYEFFSGNFPLLLRGSAEEYELAHKIFTALHPPLEESDRFSIEAVFFAIEMYLVRNEIFRNDFHSAANRGIKIVNWGEENLRFADKLDFCRLIASSYNHLNEAQLGIKDFNAAEDTASSFLVWAERASKADGHDWGDKAQVAVALDKKAICLFISSPDSIEKIIDYHRRAHEIYLSLPEETLTPYMLQAVSLNALNLARLEENKNVKMTMMQEVERSIEQIITISAGDCYAIKYAIGTYSMLVLMEIELKNFDAAQIHSKRVITFIRNLLDLNPEFYTDAMLAIMSLKMSFFNAGRDDLADSIS